MKLRIILKAYRKESLNTALTDLTHILTNQDCKISGIVALPTRIKRFCVLRSPHVDKDSREHFEIRIYKRFIDLTIGAPELINSLLKFELPAGVYSSLRILNQLNVK